jgi:hypothetical protein
MLFFNRLWKNRSGIDNNKKYKSVEYSGITRSIVDGGCIHSNISYDFFHSLGSIDHFYMQETRENSRGEYRCIHLCCLAINYFFPGYIVTLFRFLADGSLYSDVILLSPSRILRFFFFLLRHCQTKLKHLVLSLFARLLFLFHFVLAYLYS